MNKIIILTLVFSFSSAVLSATRFATYNIRHFDSQSTRTNKAELKRILDDLGADFITVEEIVNTSSFKTFLQKNYPNFRVVFSRCGGGGKQKIGFVYNAFKFKLNKYYEDARFSDPAAPSGQASCGRLRPVLVGYFEKLKTREEFVVLGVHLKAGGQTRSYNTRKIQYLMLANLVKNLKRKGQNDILVMGDFNTTGYNLNDRDYHNFSDMLADVKMETVAQKINCTAYWSGANRSDNIEESSVLDHIVYPTNFLGERAQTIKVHSHCKKVRCQNTSEKRLGISYKEVTDHCPVSITFN